VLLQVEPESESVACPRSSRTFNQVNQLKISDSIGVSAEFAFTIMIAIDDFLTLASAIGTWGGKVRLGRRHHQVGAIWVAIVVRPVC